MLEPALFRQDRVPGDVLDAAGDGKPLEVSELHTVRGEHREVAVGEEEEVAGVVEDGGNIAGHKVFVLAQPDHRRRPLPRRDDLVQILGGDDSQSKNSLELPDRGAHGLFQASRLPGTRILGTLSETFLNEVGDHFGVRLGGELVPFLLQLPLQLQVVFDDTVVNQGDRAVAVAVRVGILFRGGAVRRPARVPDSVSSVEGILADNFLEVSQLSRGAADFQSAIANHRDPR
jgi:hypothetical protein